MERAEDNNLFSWERAKRGAKIGAYAFTGILMGGSVIASAVTGVRDPEYLKYILESLYEQPTQTATILAISTGYCGVMGGIIDSFRPTSRFVTRYIREEIDTFKQVKSSLSSGYHFLRNFDYGQIPGNLSMVAELPKDFLARYFMRSTIHGGMSGLAFWGITKITEKMDGILGGDPNQLLSIVADHPVETVGIGMVAGLGIATGVLAFRPENH